MPQEPNWSKFYIRLGKVGPRMLRGVPEELQDWVKETATTTDSFFPFLLEAFETWWESSPEQAVRKTLERWAENVSDVFHDYVAFSGGTPEEMKRWVQQMDAVTLEPRDDLVAALVACTLAPLDDTGEDDDDDDDSESS